MSSPQGAEFEAAYGKLNPAQKQAVDAIEGPVMVIAGPGTGKTQILTLRIANILRRTDTAPENILALTFTESGARAMRDRLRSYVGSLAYRVPIMTFHAFADRLIREYPEYYERVIGGRAVTDIGRVRLIEDILNSGSFPLIRPMGNPIFYVEHIIAAISSMKRENVTPDVFSTVIAEREKELAGMEQYHTKGAHKGKVRSEYQKKEKTIGKSKELLAVYRLYESSLHDLRLYDYDDMILETIRALEGREDFLRTLQETYQYILADEHQDVNGSQNRILELLASYHESPNMFVVGDEKQAIYRFQGASLENFLYFEEKYPHTETIALTRNYRSGQRILDASHSLITAGGGPAQALRVPLEAEKGKEASVECRSFSHQAIEDEWVAQAVAAKLKDGVPPSEIAIIVRTNREVESCSTQLKKKGIRVSMSLERDILEHPVFRMVRSLIAAVADVGSEDALFRVLHGSYWGISPDDLLRVCAARNFEHSLSAIIRDRGLLAEKGVKNIEAVMRVGAVIDAARRRDGIEAPHRVLEYVLSESGFLDAVLSDDPQAGGAVIRRMYDEIEHMMLRKDAATLADIARVFDAHVAYGLPLTAPAIAGSHDAVSVMTAHKSKGLEFACVFIPHMTDSGWGGRSRSEYFDIPKTARLRTSEFDELDDERRLLYVAITRAKEHVYMSYAGMNAEGREFLPSRLIAEIDPNLLTFIPTDDIEKNTDPVSLLVPAVPETILSPDVVRELFLARGLSATALNNYLASPWQYIYRNILRVPEIQPPHMLFGTALHDVMRRVSRQVREGGGLPNASQIKAYLERALSVLPITVEEYAAMHEKGFAALVTYVSEAGAQLTAHAKEEFPVRVVLSTGDPDMPEITLTGTLDRLDMDAEGRAIRVVDYKSGKPKTRGYVEGTTKDSTGDYKRQLVFYALILSLLGDERYLCREGVISFLEPDDKGRVREEVFHITDEEIEDLKNEIVRVGTEIADGAWMHAPCDPEACGYCDLAALLIGRVLLPGSAK